MDGIPGPPCRKRSTGLFVLCPRIKIHCGEPPNVTRSNEAMLPTTPLRLASRIFGVKLRQNQGRAILDRPSNHPREQSHPNGSSPVCRCPLSLRQVGAMLVATTST